MEIVIYRNDLIRRIGRARLLSVTKRRIRYPYLLGHIVRHDPVIERDLGDLGIREHIPENVRLGDIIEDIHDKYGYGDAKTKQMAIRRQLYRNSLETKLQDDIIKPLDLTEKHHILNFQREYAEF